MGVRKDIGNPHFPDPTFGPETKNHIELVEMQFRIYLQEQIIWGKMRMNM